MSKQQKILQTSEPQATEIIPLEAEVGKPLSIVTNEDCMEMMSRYENKFFELAVVDPPYGIGRDGQKENKKDGFKGHEFKGWDDMPPNESYFKELFRVSKNQIIWGGNYFTNFLPVSSGWAVWNKVQRNYSFGDGELAWSSFDKALRICDYARGNENGFAPMLRHTERAGINIHPTQKPIGLYNWIFMNYAIEGQKILDTHLGSGSSRIAAYKAKLDFYGCELDKGYYEAQEARFKKFVSQLTLW